MRNAEMSVVTLLFFLKGHALTDSLMDCLIDNVFCVVQAESI